jgi:hypothetical protein
MKLNGSNPNSRELRAKTMVADPMIYNRICPANILANSRMAKLNGRIKKDNISITTSRGMSQLGIPLGKKIRKNCNRKVRRPTIIHAEKKLRDISNVNPMCAVIVNPKGVVPNKFAIKINVKIEKRAGKKI